MSRQLWPAFLLLSCATTKMGTHAIMGEQYFSRGEYHKAHLEFETAKTKKEKLPSFLSPQLLEERLKQSKQFAVDHQSQNGFTALKKKDWQAFSDSFETLTRFYPDHESSQKFLTEANEYHEKATSVLKDAETGEDKAKAVEKLLAYNWYKSQRDQFYGRYSKVVDPFHRDILQQAEALYKKDRRLDEAQKILKKAFDYHPESPKATSLREEIKLQQDAEESRKKVAKLVTKNQYAEAIQNLEIITKADPKDEASKKTLEETKVKYAYFLVNKGEKECEKKNWWACRQTIETFKQLDTKNDRQDVLLSKEKEANWAIAKDLYERSQKALSKNDPAMAMLWFRVARALGEPTSPMDEQKIVDLLNQTVKYKIGLYTPSVKVKKLPVEGSEFTLISKLHERLASDPDFSKAISIVLVQKKSDLESPDATLRGVINDFKIARKVKREARQGQYVHHIDEHPNPDYVNSQKRVVAAEGERETYFETVQKNQGIHDTALEELKSVKKQLDLDRATLANEKMECSNAPTEEDLARSKAKLDEKISDLIRSGQDDQVGALIAKWREENKIKIRECHAAKYQAQADKTEAEYNKAKAEYEQAKKRLDDSKEYYLSITNAAFDAEISHKAISKTIAVEVMKTHNYEVDIHEANAAIDIDYTLFDNLTQEQLANVKGLAEHKEQDFGTGEVGVTPPEYEYQVIQEAHEPNVRDDIEIADLLVQQAVDRLYDQIRFSLAFHGKRFVKAGAKAKKDHDKMRYALLTLFAESYLLDPKNDTKAAKETIKTLLGYDWDKKSINFDVLRKHEDGKPVTVTEVKTAQAD